MTNVETVTAHRIITTKMGEAMSPDDVIQGILRTADVLCALRFELEAEIAEPVQIEKIQQSQAPIWLRNLIGQVRFAINENQHVIDLCKIEGILRVAAAEITFKEKRFPISSHA